MPTLSLALRAEYQTLFDKCQIRQERWTAVDSKAEAVASFQAEYEAVGIVLGVPWYVVGVIHAMEGNLSFKTHLHNGDPLTARTTHVPANRPPTGAPPFDWKDSAIDALKLEKYDTWSDWTVPGILFKWELYNGWGYRKNHPDVHTPYLWSFTNQYEMGKYVEDGVWSPTTVSKQVGAAAILRRLAEKGLMTAASHASQPKLAKAIQSDQAALRFAPTKLTVGGAELQHYLNSFPDIFLKEDGKLGSRTSDAFKQVFGRYLDGDPRASAG